MNVLIIEDEAFSAMVGIAFFKDEGHAVIHATSTDEALESLTNTTPDILVSDWTIPGEFSVVDVVVKARQLNPKVRVAFVTGHSQDQLESEIDKVKPYLYYTKPVDFEKLVADLTNIASN